MASNVEPAAGDRDVSRPRPSVDDATSANGAGSGTPSQFDSVDGSVSLEGLRVLVVEDDALIGMMLQDMVEDLGMSVVGHALTRADALRMLEEREFDLAILDFNLAGESSVTVAETLVARARPFVFSTGYEARFVQGFPGVPVVSKPYEMKRLADALRETLAGGRVSPDAR